MGSGTTIAWAHATFNPWWGCQKVSPGCANCYAERWALRTARDLWKTKERRLFGEAHWREPLKWDEHARGAGERRRVFCGSMCDVFEAGLGAEVDAARRRLFGEVIPATPHLDWLLLTKRHENVESFAPKDWFDRWPENVWLGTSVEDQQRADERVPRLLAIPARVRFLSVEPMLGPVELRCLPFGGLPGLCNLPRAHNRPHLRMRDDAAPGMTGISWVIVGGESGPSARPCDVAWIRSIVAQCMAANVACFVKQLGAHVANGESDGIEWGLKMRDAKGADPDEWPEDLVVQEFPNEQRRS